MKKVLLWLWQLPQSIAGFILSQTFTDCTSVITFSGKSVVVYFSKKVFGAGVSLGKYIILDERYLLCSDFTLRTTVSHEYGHTKQSELLGPFYLLTVGIASAVRNVYDRVAHKKWDFEKRASWYYGGWPEKWADKLGNVKR